MASDSSSQQQQQEFYFVSYPFVELPELKSVERQFAENRKIRSQIIDTLKTKRVERKEALENLKPLLVEEKSYKERCNEISKRLTELEFNSKKVRVPANAGENSHSFSSEAELDRELRKLKTEFMDRNHTRIEENHLRKQIKDLDNSRGQILSIEDFNLKRKLKDISNSNEKKELRDIDSQIFAMEKDLKHYSQIIDQAYPYLQQLRMQRYKNNELCLQMRAERDDAIFDYFANPNASSLVDRSTIEVEKFMKTWNENKEFREEYEQRKLAARNAQYARNSSDA